MGHGLALQNFLGDFWTRVIQNLVECPIDRGHWLSIQGGSIFYDSGTSSSPHCFDQTLCLQIYLPELYDLQFYATQQLCPLGLGSFHS